MGWKAELTLVHGSRCWDSNSWRHGRKSGALLQGHCICRVFRSRGSRLFSYLCVVCSCTLIAGKSAPVVYLPILPSIWGIGLWKCQETTATV